jgi:elongation factor G
MSTAAVGAGHAAALRCIRNIGIGAHIDAGKTTTTERMLFFAGVLPRCGEVHDGDTATDFLPQERERGITIKAAAITFGWGGATVNLIDTPGHVDFTMEVERAFRVLDGAVLLYDAVSGVEAQSETVWLQAERYGVSRIAFANKLDREGASFDGTCASLASRLRTKPLPLHMPLGEAGAFAGVVDLLTMEAVTHSDKAGASLVRTPLAAAVEASAAAGRRDVVFDGRSDGQGSLVLHAADCLAAARAARLRLLESLADVDEGTGDAYLSAMDAGVDLEMAVGEGAPPAAAGFSASALRAALRRVVCTPTSPATPVLAGSAFKNKGVQLLLDAVAAYLPSPLDKPPAVGREVSSGARVDVTVSPTAPMRALAFKVQNHPSRGPLVYFRVYSGVLMKGMPLIVPSASGPAAGKGVSKKAGREEAAAVVRERPSKLLQLMADEAREVEGVGAGHIGAAVGLKFVRTGDTLVAASDPRPVTLPRLSLPQPVFSAALEVGGPAEQRALESALEVMTREDPSLRVTLAEASDSGQTLLAGMGELHLDVAAETLRREYGVPVTLGRMRVAYRESLAGAVGGSVSSEGEAAYDKTMGGKRQVARVALTVTATLPGSKSEWSDMVGEGADPAACAFEGDEEGNDEELRCVVVGLAEEGSSGKGRGAVALDADGLRPMPADLADALREGLASAFGRGPVLGSPLIGLRVRLDGARTEVGPDSTPAAMRAAVARALSAALTTAGCDLLEPTMDVTIVSPEGTTGALLSELAAARRGRVKEVTSAAEGSGVALGGGKTLIRAEVPLRELIGYSTALRSVTSGEGSFSMEFAIYAAVGPVLQRRMVLDPSTA